MTPDQLEHVAHLVWLVIGIGMDWITVPFEVK